MSQEGSQGLSQHAQGSGSPWYGACLSLNKELGPRLKVKAHHRILLQGGGNQPWQHEQYPQCKRMETGVFLPMGKAINQP